MERTNILKKRIQSLMILSTCIAVLGISVPAMASEDLPEDAEVQVELTDQTMEMSDEADSQEQIVPEVTEEESVESVSEVTVEKHTITGFASFDIRGHYLHCSPSSRPDIDSLVAKMPETLDVYLDGSMEATAIDVTWYDACGDYEEERAYYYQFSPEWDEEIYVLADELDLVHDAPYVGVFFDKESSGITLSTSAVTANINEVTIYNYLVNVMKVNRGVAAGVLANIERESGFDPKASHIEKSGLESYGICQWNGTRLHALETHSGKAYKDTTLSDQLDYLYYELQTTEKIAWSKINVYDASAEGAYNAAYNWAKYFERCTSSEFEVRGNLARDLYWPEYQNAPVQIVEDHSVGSWVKDSIGWRWKYADGTYASNQWLKDEGEWYYLKSNGYMAANAWAKDSHGWCWMGSNGKIVKSKWIKSGGEWYYLKSNGYMAANEWAKDSVGWCWLAASGKIVKKSWIKDKGEWYYLKPNGYMAANAWAKDSHGWCWMGSNGKIVKNKWIKTGGYWYYLKSNGYMAANEWAKDSVKWYWMKSNGRISGS